MDHELNAKEQLEEWWNPRVDPVIDAIYLKDRDLGLTNLSRLEKELAASGLSADQQCAGRYKLCYLNQQFRRLLGMASPTVAFETTLAGLNEPPVGPVSTAYRARLLIQVRTTAQINRNDYLPPEEFQQLFHDVPREYRNPEFWHYVASWGFMHRNEDLVKRALVMHTVHADEYQADVMWQRINLLYLLLTGQARREHLLRLLEAVTNPLQLESLERLIFKACKEAGLIDAEVRILVARKRREFDEQPPVIP